MDVMVTAYDNGGRVLDMHCEDRADLNFDNLARIMRKQNPGAVRLVFDIALDYDRG